MSNPSTFVSTALSIDNINSVIVVCGRRTKDKDNRATAQELLHVGKGKKQQTVVFQTKNKFTLTLCVAIKHADDSNDFSIAEKIINQRFKKKEYHLQLVSDQFLGDDLCRAIVENEAQYIAMNTNQYIEKMRRSYKRK